MKFKLNQTYPVQEQMRFKDFQDGCHGGPMSSAKLSATSDTVWEQTQQITTEDFQDGCRGVHHGDVENVKSYWRAYGWRTDHGQQTMA